MLNLTLTALTPRFPTFQPSDFTLWFQVNLAVLLVSVRPASLSVIPMNISCDSFKAMWDTHTSLYSFRGPFCRVKLYRGTLKIHNLERCMWIFFWFRIAAFDESLKTLPPGISADLRSSRDYLAQILPQGSTCICSSALEYLDSFLAWLWSTFC